jgi:hypothetical protein
MLKVLSKKESKILEKETNKWLLALDWNTKFKIKALLEPIIAQTNCEHDWIDPNTYKNELDKTKLFCRKCNLTKLI